MITYLIIFYIAFATIFTFGYYYAITMSKRINSSFFLFIQILLLSIVFGWFIFPFVFGKTAGKTDIFTKL